MWRFFYVVSLLFSLPYFSYADNEQKGDVAQEELKKISKKFILNNEVPNIEKSKSKFMYKKRKVLLRVGGISEETGKQSSEEHDEEPATGLPSNLSAEINFGGAKVRANNLGIYENNSYAYAHQPNLVPPTAIAQFVLTPEERVKPYVGLGLNYTNVAQETVVPRNMEKMTVYQQDTFGSAIQLGTDIDLSDNIFLNIDAKKLNMRFSTDGHPEQDFSRWVYGIGLGIKF